MKERNEIASAFEGEAEKKKKRHLRIESTCKKEGWNLTQVPLGI